MFKFKEINEKVVKHAFFSRKGGLSKGIYDSLNCSFGSKDNKNIIKKNREIALKKLGIQNKILLVPHQTHSNTVKFVTEKTKPNILADGIITKSNKIALGILTADCAPVFLFDNRKKIISAIHVGWKGAVNNIIYNSVKLMLDYGSNPNNIISCIGPCIAQNSYFVKSDFLKKFMSENIKNKKFFKFLKKEIKFNLKLYINYKLKEAGIKKTFYKSFDTYIDKKNFFSFRRSKNKNELDYGRCISIISLN